MSDKINDRFPSILAAGKKKVPNGITTELKNYTNSEIADNLIEKNKLRKKFQNIVNTGVIPKPDSDTVQSIIEINFKKSRFKEFEENFYEDLYYQSMKAGGIGQSAKKLSTPKEITNTCCTFGKPNKNCDSFYDIVFPKKTTIDVLREQQVFHEKYRLSHNSYFPSEQVRRYPTEIFNQSNKKSTDTSGKEIKNILKDCSIGKTNIISKIQADYVQRNSFEIGKAIKRQNFNFQEEKIFGSKRLPDQCNLSCIIHNTQPYSQRIELLEAVSYINKLRNRLKNKTDFNLMEIELTLRGLNTCASNYLNWSIIFQALASYYLYVDHEKIKLISNHLNIIDNDGNVNFVELLKLFNCNAPLPNLSDVIKLPELDTVFCTTYNQFHNKWKSVN